MNWWNLYAVAFVFATCASLVTTPVCKRLARLSGFVDKPRQQEHKTHQQPTPLLGGMAMFSAWAGTIVFGLLATRSMADSPLFQQAIANYLPGIASVDSEIAVIALGALLAALLGLADDRWNMSARTKLAGQLAIALMVATWGGVRVSLFISDPLVVGAATVVWMLVVFNAINFFDNMDGLAVGTATIALSFFTIAAAINSQYFVASLCAVTAGSALGFWFYNHSPASIFMGDSGSHFLGYILAITGAKVTYYNPELSTTRFPILIPLFILGIPLFDSAAVVVIRLVKRKPIYIGDNNHISHRFVRMGMSRRKAVFMVHLLTLLIGLGVLPMLWGDEATSIVSLIQMAVILLLISCIQYGGFRPAIPEPPPKKQLGDNPCVT